MSPAFQAPRGTHDVLPGDHLWWHVVRVIEEQTAQYGWQRIQTPGFEDTALFERTAGEASDVVHKEMYTFVDRGDRSLTLRHTQHNDRPLDDGANEVLKHVARLWGFGVHLESVNGAGDVTRRWNVPAP